MAHVPAAGRGPVSQELITAARTYTAPSYHPLDVVVARELCTLLGQEMMLPMDTGAEAVESAIKLARKRGCERKGVASDRARIVVAHGNFHGRTTTVISFSDDDGAQRDSGPYTPGSDSVPYGNLAALEEAVTADTVAALLEPIQGRPASWSRPLGTCRASGGSPPSRTSCSSPTRAGIDIDPRLGTGREGCERLAAHGVLTKDTRGLGHPPEPAAGGHRR